MEKVWAMMISPSFVELRKGERPKAFKSILKGRTMVMESVFFEGGKVIGSVALPTFLAFAHRFKQTKLPIKGGVIELNDAMKAEFTQAKWATPRPKKLGLKAGVARRVSS